MPRIFIYVVERDFGFAPNPFHGCCTLATCKPGVRAHADVGDWVIGMGGTRLDAVRRCIFAMRVDDAISFSKYWSSDEYRAKRPVRNGSSTMMVGDNIYSFDDVSKGWNQADSHHSNTDGTPNVANVLHDTKVDRVLISRYFFYFGKAAPAVPADLLAQVGYTNVRNYRVFDWSAARDLVEWLHEKQGASLNIVVADPFDFSESDRRYSARDNKIR